MFATTQSFPVQSIFGAGFIAERHIEDTQRKLPMVEQEWRLTDFSKALRGLVFGHAEQIS